MSVLAGFWLSLLSLSLSLITVLIFGRKPGVVRVAGTLFISLGCIFLALGAISAISGEGHPAEFEVNLGIFHFPVLIDGLSGLFLLLLSVLVLTSVIFFSTFTKKDEPGRVQKYYLALPVFIAGLIGLLTVDDLGPGFTLSWQLMAISSYFLVRMGRPDKISVRPARVYLLFMEAAWLMIISSAFLTKNYQFGNSLAIIGEKLAHSGRIEILIFFSLLLAGFGLKTGLFPLGQFWIPGAYSTASPPVSALLAGILEKTGVFGLIRIFFFVAKEAGANFNPDLWGKVLVISGTLTLFIGTVQAMKQSDYLRLLAYSSIGQVGYIIFALGSSLLAWNSGSQAIRQLAAVIFLGALYHSLNHGIFKSLLFLVGGSLLYSTGTRDLNRLGGLLAVMPVTGILAALSSYSIAGMPASSGFVSKWLMISGNFLAGRNSLLLTFSGIVALFTAAFTLACYVKFFGLAFTSVGAQWKIKKEIKEVPTLMLFPKILLMLICLSQAFMPLVYINLLSKSLNHSEGFLFSGMFTGHNLTNFKAEVLSLKIFDGRNLLAATGPLIILLIIVVLIFLARWFRQSAGSAEVTVPTWLCGYQDLNQDNIYVDRNMFSDLKKFFWWTGGNKVIVVDDDGELAGCNAGTKKDE